MAENDVTIQINLDAKDAQAAIELFGKESVKVLQKTEKQSDNFFNTFKIGALKLAGAFGAITTGYALIKTGIEEAVQEAKLTRQIEASLLAVGEASKSTVEGILDFADSIKQTTGISDDLVKSTFIIAQNFGISTEKAKQLTSAAIDLAAATGTDVETSVRLLGGTLDGTIGKLGNYGAEFRNLTKAQLEAGDAIDLVSKKFGGAASKDLDTFSGRLSQLTNSFNDFLKEAGKTVVESTVVQKALQITAEGIDLVTEALKRRNEIDFNSTEEQLIRESLSPWGRVANAIKLATDEAKAFQDIDIGGQSKAIADGFAGIVQQANGASKATGNFIERFNQIEFKNAPKTIGLTGKALEEAQKKAEEAAKAFQQLRSKFSIDITDEVSKIKARYEQERLEVEAFSKKYPEYRRKAADLIVNIEKNKTNEINKYNLEQAQKLNDDLRKSAAEQKAYLQSVFENPFGNLAEKFQLQIVRAIRFVQTGQDLGSPFKEGEIAASIVGGITLAAQGRQGAIKAFSAIGEAIGQSLGIPGIGALTELLARGPEENKKFIKEFVKSIPDIIQAIAESIPAIVESLVDTLINKGGIIRIAVALAKAFAGQATLASVGKQIFGKTGEELGTVIRTGFLEGAKKFADEFTKFFNDFGSSIKSFFNQIGPNLVKFFQEGLTQAFSAISNLFKPLTDVLTAVQDGLQKLIDPIERLINALSAKGATKGIQDLGKKIGDYLDQRGLGGATKAAAALEPLVNPVAAYDYLTGKRSFFAKGGLVYAANGFFSPKGTDTVPAMLTPGEMVVPRDMVSELGSFLMSQKPDAPGNDAAILSAIYSAVNSPIIVKTEAKVNQQAFADIILQLNRQNARLSA